MDHASKNVTMPSLDKVAQIIGGLVGRNVVARRSGPVARGANIATATAVYIGDSADLRGATVSDVALVCNAGAALTLYPPLEAAQCVRRGQWNDTLTENFHEVLNVSANLFNQPGAPHARLQRVYLTPEPLPEVVEAAMRRAAARLDVEVTIPGYGAGKLSVLAF